MNTAVAARISFSSSGASSGIAERSCITIPSRTESRRDAAVAFPFAPWAGDSAIDGHPAFVDFLIYDYLLTGNRRSRDVLHEWVEGLKRSSPGGRGTREGITALAEMVEAYRFTWDAALVELMDRFAAAEGAEAEALKPIVFASINGIAAAMQSTG